MNVEIGELKKQVQAIQASVEELRATGLRDSLLFIAIQKSAMRFNGGKPIGITQIRNILDGIEWLDEYMFPPVKEEG